MFMLVNLAIVHYHPCMSLEIPASFRLDAGGELCRALELDTLATLLDVQASFMDTEFCRLAYDAVDLLLPNLNTANDMYKSNAFTTSALVIAAAFHEADAGEEIRRKALRVLAIRSAPQNMLGETQAETLASFQRAAIQAHKRHPEIRDATSMLIDFHVETSQDVTMSRYALCGSGL